MTLLRAGAADQAPGHLSIFTLGPIPLLMALGEAIGDLGIEVEVFNHYLRLSTTSAGAGGCGQPSDLTRPSFAFGGRTPAARRT